MVVPSVPAAVRHAPGPDAPQRAQVKLVGVVKTAAGPDDSYALIAVPSGGPQVYRKGDQVGAATLARIGDDYVLLQDAQGEFRLSVAAGTRGGAELAASAAPVAVGRPSPQDSIPGFSRFDPANPPVPQDPSKNGNDRLRKAFAEQLGRPL
ncbi:MAG: hypothetical protein HYX47_13895 [Burkholderiales bacterium]|nr:hypothetical protein [Burkholderiales bacterium]